MPLTLQQNGSRTTRNILLVVFLVISIALTVVYAREGEDGPVHAVQNGFMGVSGQAGSVTAGLSAAADSTGDTISDLTADPTTLSGLRQQNEELREMLSDAEEYRQEADRLRGLLDMKKLSGVTGPIAHIVGRSTNAWDQSITIDLGSEEGVQSGMTIMGATGVLGQVSRTSAHTSTVRLLTDPNSGAAVMIQSNRENGIVRGSISGTLFLEDLSENVIPSVGDVIVTSGLGGSYERGLIVGSVVSVNKSTSNPTGTIVVKPNDSASVLEEVIVVITAPDVAAIEKQDEEKAAREAAEKEAQQSMSQEAEGLDSYDELSGTDDYSYGFSDVQDTGTETY